MAILCLIYELFGCKRKPRPRLTATVVGEDEPIPRKSTSMTITKPIAPGYRRKLAVKSDYPLDVRVDGGYLGSEVVDGDSSAPTVDESNPNGGNVWINGDGSTGNKTVRILADGHVGDGEVGITLDITYTVANPDATVLTASEVGADEPIPGVTPPVPPVV